MGIMKYLIGLFTVLIFLIGVLAQHDCDWFEDTENYFEENCPIQRGDYNGCCLCTQYYYYGCECCRDVVDEIGVLGDCSKWGEPTGNDEFCTVVDKTEPPKDKSNENSEIKVQQ